MRAVVCMIFFSIFVTLVAEPQPVPFNRDRFPADFIFGAASSAFQYEGAANKAGRGASIWDTFTYQFPEKIEDHSDASVADDFFHRYKDDIKIMKEIGLDSFRLSLSWSRILPGGKITTGVNKLGIKYYNDLINELIANGIKPLITLFHWDLPQALEDEYNGFLSRNIVNDYRNYVELCFREFGDRVKYWITLNEPNNFSMLGYATGELAPGRCSYYIGNCTAGDSAIEPYVVVHNFILAHAAAVRLYKEKYQASQGGVIGITIATDWTVPINETTDSVKAASRAFDFLSGWILEPITRGDYPETMKLLVNNRLPKFSKAESDMIKQSFDFLGLNYYTAYYAANDPIPSTNLSYTTDLRATLTQEKDGIPIGEPTDCSRIYIYPEGILSLMRYIKDKYNDPIVIITENGVADSNNSSLPLLDALQDQLRIKYHRLHLSYLLKAIKEGANVKGYFAWSFFDDFEWNAGYTYRFGINFIDYDNGLRRYPKSSALWFKNFLREGNNIPQELQHSSMR